ncbi:MAG: MATE family efflux transporter [Treponema sp.]|nr:MATE family efflux transporter [Treponema sp.]
MQKNLTEGNVFSILIRFSLPYLLSCFLQTFYGLADLFITGQFYGASTISAVSIGSQLMHMFTVIIAGLAMGTTVCIGRSVGEKNKRELSRVVGNSITIFIILASCATILLMLFARPVLRIIFTPQEAFAETLSYVLICFAGIPFITAYNVLSSIFRGLGDTKSPMYFVLVAGLFNIILDYIFIGLLHWGAGGAAAATIISQALSVAFALFSLRRIKAKGGSGMGLALSRSDLRVDSACSARILKIGVPIALQDGLIQVSFIVITAIANSRGLAVAAAVGIVEKIICFLFLVPSAMLSSVSAIGAQNAGARLHDRSRKTLFYAIAICLSFGAIVFTACQFYAEEILRLFSSSEEEVIRLGAGYLRSYTFDCMFAGVHFCFSGFFCAYGKSLYSFIHNILSIVIFRIPGALLASIKFPDTLYPMGLAAPIGSLFSIFVCLAFFYHLNKEIGRLFQPQSGAVD